MLLEERSDRLANQTGGHVAETGLVLVFLLRTTPLAILLFRAGSVGGGTGLYLAVIGSWWTVGIQFWCVCMCVWEWVWAGAG